MAQNTSLDGFTFGRSFMNSGCCFCATATKGSFSAHLSNDAGAVVRVAVQCCPKCRDAGTISPKLNTALDAAISQGYTKLCEKPTEGSAPVASDAAPEFKIVKL
jgi:hypothetical protein